MPYIFSYRLNSSSYKRTKNNVIDSIIKLNKINAEILFIERLNILK